MQVAKVIINCPEMPILRKGLFLRECQELVCPKCYIAWNDGLYQQTKNLITEFQLTFPRAMVRCVDFGQWVVDEVPAVGMDANGDKITCTMEKERVVRSSWNKMVAQPCKGYGSYRGFRVVVDFPQCVTTARGFGFTTYIAEPVQAVGYLEADK